MIGRGIVVVIFSTIIGLVVGFSTYGIFTISFGDVDIILNILIIIPIFVLFTWLLSIPLGGLSHMNPAFYFATCLVAAIIICIMSATGKFFDMGESEGLAAAIGAQSGLWFVIVPKINSESSDYLVTETTYYDGYEISKHEYVETRYLCGSLVKLVMVAIIGGVCGYFTYGGAGLIILIFEGCFLLFKVIQSIRAMR